MKLYDDLTKVFCEDWFHLENNGGIAEIKEDGKQATVRKAELVFRGQMMSIDKGIFEKTDFLFKPDEKVGEKMPKLQHSCDGVLIIEWKNQKYIVFIELKSDYTCDNIRKAEIQICASYLRTMALLNCVDGFDPRKYKICGIIVSHPMDVEKLNLALKRKNSNKKLTRFDRQCMAFSSNSKTKSFPMDKIYSMLGGLPVADHLRFDSLPTFHFNINKGCHTGRFYLDEVLNLL